MLSPLVTQGGCNRHSYINAALFLEKYVVARVGLEGRVRVNQADAAARDVVARNFQVIDEVKLVLFVHYGKAYHNVCSWRIPLTMIS
jgi:Iap family predicted aminopeptidase